MKSRLEQCASAVTCLQDGMGSIALKEAFQQYGVNGEVRIYPDAGHAFFNDTRPDVYNAAAAQDAWTRALGLFSRTLKS